MTERLIESQVEAEQLRRRIAWLSDENRTLRDLADPTAAPLRLQAENILLRREVDTLHRLVPTLVPYDGPLPETLADWDALPDPHRRQVAAEHPDHLLKLRQVEQLLRQADGGEERPGEGYL